MKFNSGESDRSCFKALAFLILVDRNCEGESLCVPLTAMSGSLTAQLQVPPAPLIIGARNPGTL